MSVFLKTWPTTVAGLAMLGALTVFGYTGRLSGPDTYNAFLGFLGLVGATGLFILASQFSNANALPHFIVGLATVVAIIVLGLHFVFTNTQILGILFLVFTGTAGSAVAVGVTSQPAAPATPVAPAATVDTHTLP